MRLLSEQFKEEPFIDKRRGNDGSGFYIRTYSGAKFHFDRLDENEYRPEDIAHALSMNCRWTGHVRRFYSVAQHCCLASYEAPEGEELAALLHDASEAYVHDTPSPLKWYLADHDFTAFSDLEKGVDKAIFKAFRLPYPRNPVIKHIDVRLLATESRDLMPEGEERMYMAEPYPWHIEPWSPQEAERQYIKRMCELTSGETNVSRRSTYS